MGMATGSTGNSTTVPEWLDVYDTAAGHTNQGEREGSLEPKSRRRKRAKAQQKSVDHLYADLIKAGLVRIERKKGRPPRIIWL